MILGMNVEMFSLFDDHKLSVFLYTVAIQLSNHKVDTSKSVKYTKSIAIETVQDTTGPSFTTI